MIKPTFQGELQLMNWGESSNSGAWVKFWISTEDLEMFRSLKCRSGKIAGHRLAAVLVEIGDDDLPVAQIEPAKPKGGDLARLAGIWCNDPSFWAWLETDQLNAPSSERGAAMCLYSICEIESRAELDNDEAAAERFHRLIRIPYSQWLKDAPNADITGLAPGGDKS